MEHLYTVHTKLLQDKTHYFVKKIMALSEFKGLANVLVGYGMHTNFEKACSIAGIHDSTCRKQLLLELEERNLPCLPDRQATGQAGKAQKPMKKHSVQIADTVNRRLAERGAEVLN